jgi:hypothetical protein
MNLLKPDIEIPFRFTERPTPLAGDLRPIWRIGLILLILLYSRGQKATLQKLHLLNSVSRFHAARQSYLRYAEGKAKRDEIIPRIEPSLNRALNFARGQGLLQIEKGKNIKLTARGLTAALKLDEKADCLAAEREFLKAVKSFSTESNIEDLFTWNLTI